MSTITNTFSTAPGFCPDCGSILPLLQQTDGVTCYTCSKVFSPEVFENMQVKYTIHFNSRDLYAKSASEQNKGDDGPVIDRKCPKCGNEKMSYATLQLRSADEGQTVFYTCTKCKFKENENS